MIMITVTLIYCLTEQIMAPPPSTALRLTRTKKIKQKRVHIFQTWKKQMSEHIRLRLIDLKKYITKNNHLINNNINENSNNKKKQTSLHYNNTCNNNIDSNNSNHNNIDNNSNN